MEDNIPAVPAIEHPSLTNFYQRFVPADSFKDATDHFTTHELCAQLNENDPSLVIMPSDLHAWLLKSGYKQEVLSEMKMVWVVKEQ